MADLRLLIEVLTKGDANLSRLGTQLDTVDKKAQTVGERLKGALNPGKILAGAGIALGAQQVISFLGDSISAASDLGETISATSVILGKEALPALQDWAKEAETSLGLSERAALDAAQTFATFGKSAGLAGPELSDFSTDLTGLASDLASFKNTSPEEAITAIGAALRGESEPIRRYGVLLDDATLRQRALKLGIVETTRNALTPQQKVLAAQAEIWAQTTDAQGDFARTSDGLANKQRVLAAQMENVSAKIGEKLLPLALDFATFVSDDLIPILLTLADVFGAVGDVLAGVGDLFTTIAGSGATFRGWLDDTIGGMLGLSSSTDTAAESTAWLTDEARHAIAAVEQVGGVVQATAEISEREWKRIAAEPAGIMAAQNAAIRDAAFQHQVQYAKGLLDGQNQPLVQMEALQQLQEETLTVSAEKARLLGQLNSEELAGGLADGRPVVRSQAEATRLAIINQLANLGIDASSWGYGIGASLASGINNGYGTVINAAGNLAAAVRGQIGIESEPKDSSSPLRGITQWGANLVQTYVEGMQSMMRTGENAGMALAAAVSPQTASLVGFSSAGTSGAFSGLPAAPSGSGDLHVHLTNVGEPIEEPDDILQTLKLLVPHIRDAVSNG